MDLAKCSEALLHFMLSPTVAMLSHGSREVCPRFVMIVYALSFTFLECAIQSDLLQATILTFQPG